MGMDRIISAPRRLPKVAYRSKRRRFESRDRVRRLPAGRRRRGVLSRHVHPAPVHGLVLEGSWRYLEHDWVARKGMYVFEPPGEIHTLVVDADVAEMITFFNISGAMIYLDQEDRTIGYEDVYTKI